LIGCGAQGVVGSGRELEEGGVAVWAATLPGMEVDPFHVEVAQAEQGLGVTGVRDFGGGDEAVVLAAPQTCPAEPWAAQPYGAWTVGTRVRVGQTVLLQVRDAAAAHEDLTEALDREAATLGAPPAGALLFTCNGRGSGMFGTPDHDARAVAEAFAGAPTGGF